MCGGHEQEHTTGTNISLALGASVRLSVRLISQHVMSMTRVQLIAGLPHRTHIASYTIQSCTNRRTRCTRDSYTYPRARAPVPVDETNLQQNMRLSHNTQVLNTQLNGVVIMVWVVLNPSWGILGGPLAPPALALLSQLVCQSQGARRRVAQSTTPRRGRAHGDAPRDMVACVCTGGVAR